ncbi:ATP synthase epsilon chain [Bartonella australis AUST/NH1]|uniref:ATP synthase epsilon chain n=1 Tax=Bartonella australis (strain Aust/NH1) TaxID=1094489 RepID=M1P081_BARAA|nr:ATP synthase F1 subunit epsilon [Bartonella australis]AGF75042.1 ATP synthase epsilon chain [Bartonella australis AUST/NH1]
MENNEAKRFLFEIVTPEKLIFSEEVVSVVLPSASGYLTVMAHHAPLMVSIVPGSILVASSSGEKQFAVWGGVADITSAGCSLLAEAVITADHLPFHDLEQRILQIRAMLGAGSTNEHIREIKELFYQLAVYSGDSVTEAK